MSESLAINLTLYDHLFSYSLRTISPELEIFSTYLTILLICFVLLERYKAI